MKYIEIQAVLIVSFAVCFDRDKGQNNSLHLSCPFSQVSFSSPDLQLQCALF